MLVSAKTLVLALAVAYRNFVKFWMAELPVLYPWSRIFSAPVTELSTW
jgi:hypothetical protein